MVYLPFFMVPLKFLALFSYQISLMIWYLINFSGFVLYFDLFLSSSFRRKTRNEDFGFTSSFLSGSLNV